MSPILLKIFVEVVEGTYFVAAGSSTKRNLKINDALVEHDFVVITEDEEDK